MKYSYSINFNNWNFTVRNDLNQNNSIFRIKHEWISEVELFTPTLIILYVSLVWNFQGAFIESACQEGGRVFGAANIHLISLVTDVLVLDKGHVTYNSLYFHFTICLQRDVAIMAQHGWNSQNYSIQKLYSYRHKITLCEKIVKLKCKDFHVKIVNPRGG